MRIVIILTLALSQWSSISSSRAGSLEPLETGIDAELSVITQLFRLEALPSPSPVPLAVVRLGRQLFHEPALSGNRNISCADCHSGQTFTHDRLPLAVGHGSTGREANGGHRLQGSGALIARNSPALFNLDAQKDQPAFWDGRAWIDPMGFIHSPELRLHADDPVLGSVAQRLDDTIALQALFPLVNADEMMGYGTSHEIDNEIATAPDRASAWERLVARVLKLPQYPQLFADAFPGETPTIAHVANAIAAFEKRAFFAANTAYDSYLKGDKNALTPLQKQGMKIFFTKGKCGECHQGALLSDMSFQAVGVPQVGPGTAQGDDEGRKAVDGRPENKYAFRVPPLRNVALTAPYFHNGSFSTLSQVIEHYDDIETSLNEYVFQSRTTSNYRTPIADHNPASNSQRLNGLSSKLARKLEFQETEERALLEFLRGALTDKRFLDEDPEGVNEVFYRLDLQPRAHQRLTAQARTEGSGWSRLNEINLHVDVFRKGGYYLRELESPVRLQIRWSGLNESGEKVPVRAWASEVLATRTDLVAAETDALELPAQFQTAAGADLGHDTLFALESDAHTFFNELYSARDTAVLKRSATALKHELAQAFFPLHDWLAPRLLLPVQEWNFAPTSINQKQGYVTSLPLNLSTPLKVKARLLSNWVRSPEGEPRTTYSLELIVPAFKIRDRAEVNRAIAQWLSHRGVTGADLGAPVFSPSKLTEQVLNEVCGRTFEECH